MITVKNRRMIVPPEERFLGVETDTNSSIRVFRIPRYITNEIDLSSLSFFLDIRYEDNTTNETAFIDMLVSDNSMDLTWYIAANDLGSEGAIFLQLKANDLSGKVKWKSFIEPFFVGDCIDAAGQYTGDLSAYEALVTRCVIIENREVARIAAEELRQTNTENAINNANVATQGALVATSGAIIATERANQAAEIVEGIVADKIGINDYTVSLSEGWSSYKISTELEDIVYNIKSFGAVGDGIHDDAPAIRAAIEAASINGGGKVLVPPGGVYLLVEYIPTIYMGSPYGYGYYYIEGKDNVTIIGGGETSVLKVKDNVYPSIEYSPFGVNVFGSENKKNFHIKNLKIDCNGENNLHPGGGAIRTFYAAFFHLGEDCSVENCYIYNCPGRNSIVFGLFVPGTAKGIAKRALVKNNVIHNSGSAVLGNVHQDDHTCIYCDWEDSTIKDNEIKHDIEPTAGMGGIELHNSNIRATNNKINRCTVGLYMVADFAPWTPNTAYELNTIIVPTKAKFADKQYKCTTAGTSGVTEPDWGATNSDNTATWEENGNAEVVNQRVERNTFKDCIQAVSIWNSPGNLKSCKILYNTIACRKFDTVTTTVLYGIVQAGFNENIDALSIIEDFEITGNEIYENMSLKGTNEALLYGILLSSAKNIKFHDNNIHHISAVPISLYGSPRGVKNIEFSDNTIHDFNINNSTEAKPAIYFNMSGSSIIPFKTAFDAEHIIIKDNKISNDVYSALACGYSFNWSDASTITDLVVKDNTLTNLGHIAVGAKASLVQVLPLLSDTGYYMDSNGFIHQWKMVYFNAGAGYPQSFTFPIPFTSACFDAHPTLQGLADTYVSNDAIPTTTQVTIRCGANNRTIFISAIGH